MVKVVELNKIKKAAKWIAEQLGDDGYTSEYLIELGIRRELTLQAVIPKESLPHPRDLMSYGLRTEFLNGVIDLNALDCRVLQAQGSIKASEVKSDGVLLKLDRTVTITYDDVRIRKDVLERYVANRQEHEPSKEERIDSAPRGANENAVPPAQDSRGATKQQIMNAFEGLCFDRDHWGKNLASPPNWLAECRVTRGSKKAPSTWNPARIGAALHDKGISLKRLDAVFVGLREWAGEWADVSDIFRS